MIELGKTNRLTISRQSAPGLYLCCEQGEEVLLPNRYIPTDQTDGWEIGSELDVFVYMDSEDRIVATTERPLLEVDGLAALTVVATTRVGAFMDWGLSKDLLVPHSNQHTPLYEGDTALVTAYVDLATDRIVGSTRIGRRFSNDAITLERGDRVEILVAQRVERGYRVAVNDAHWGMLYDSQIFRNIEIGYKAEAWVTRVTDEGRIDVALQREGFDQVKIAADSLVEMLKQNNGTLELGDRSDPEQVQLMTGFSKKVFKRAAGYLLSAEKVTVTPTSISLK